MVNELIKVEVSEDGKKLVSARDLHEGLGSKDRFSKWFDRMISYGFEENMDYTGVKKFTVVNNGANQELQDYAITLDMAKEISMIQRNDIGKKFRQYFIEKEKECAMLNTIIDNSSDENAKLERNKYRFGCKKTLGTFSNCEALKLPDLYKEFSEYISTLDTDTRLSRYASALKGVSKLIENITGQLIYTLPVAQKVQYDIKSDMETLRNRQNGGIKGCKTKMINELTSELSKHKFDESKLFSVEYHPMSIWKLHENGHRTEMYNS